MKLSTLLSSLFAVAALTGFLLPTQVLAQGGDSCEVATVVDTIPYSNTGTTVGMTYNYDASCFSQGGGDGAPDVVYSFTPDTSAAIDISLCSGATDYDTKMWVFKDTCLSSDEVACNDDACTAPNFPNDPWVSNLQMWVDSGSTYYIVIGGYSDQDAGAYTVNIDWVTGCQDPFAFALDSLNDNIAIISWSSLNVGGTYVFEYGVEGFIQGMGDSLTGTITADGQVVTMAPLLEGTTYDIYVTESCDTTDVTIGPLQIETTAPPPANDMCAGAITVVACDTTYTGNTTFATDDDTEAPAACGAGGIDVPGVWYYMAGIDTAVTVSTCNQAEYDTRISVFSGSCANLVCVAGNDDNVAAGCGGFTSELTFTMTSGTDYYILIHGFPGNAPQGEFDMTITCEAPCTPQPQNDDCANAAALSIYATDEGQITSGTIECAVPATANPDCDPFGVIADVWYSFNSDSITDANIIVDAGTATSLDFAVYDVCGNDPLICDTGFTSPIAISGLAANTTYYVQIWNGGGPQAGTFDISMESSQVTGIYNAFGRANARLFPNPATEQVTVSLSNSGSASSLRIFSLHGQQVYARDFGRGNASITQTIDVSEFAKGVYLVRYHSDDAQLTRKLVIE